MRKDAKTFITILCRSCQKPFQKELSEYKYRRKQGYTRFYCMNPCSKQINVYIPFQHLLHTVEKRSQKSQKGFDLDVEYLKDLWERQKGVCPYTGIKMGLPRNIKEKQFIPDAPSIDRIDSSKGYVKGNIEFVCLSVNYAKNGFTKNQTIEFFDKVRNGRVQGF